MIYKAPKSEGTESELIVANHNWQKYLTTDNTIRITQYEWHETLDTNDVQEQLKWRHAIAMHVAMAVLIEI